MGFRVRLLSAVLLVLAIVAPPVAGAAQRPALGHRTAAGSAVAHVKARAPLALAVTVARRYWGATPCHGQIEVITRRPLPPGLGADSDAWVTFGTSLGANDLAAPASGYTDCTIALGRLRWPTRASMSQDWDMLCMTVTHEFGHLLGHAHDSSSGSVMAPIFRDYTSEPQICRTARPRSASARGLHR